MSWYHYPTLPLCAAGILAVLETSLGYWVYRVYVGKHPLKSDPKKEPWVNWFPLLIAVLEIEFPAGTTFLTLALSALTALYSGWLAGSLIGVMFLLCVLYHHAEEIGSGGYL